MDFSYGKPQTIEKPKLVDKAPVKRMITGSVNFYETADLTDTPVTAIATEPVVEKVQNTPVQVLAEEPAADVPGLQLLLLYEN